MTAAMNTCAQRSAGMSSTSRYASSCACCELRCVMGTAAAVSIFVALSVRLCTALHMVRISMLWLGRICDKSLIYS